MNLHDVSERAEMYLIVRTNDEDADEWYIVTMTDDQVATVRAQVAKSYYRDEITIGRFNPTTFENFQTDHKYYWLEPDTDMDEEEA